MPAERVHDPGEARWSACSDDERRVPAARGGALCDVNGAVAVHGRDDERDVAPFDDRFELGGMTPADVAAMELDLVPRLGGAPLDLGLVPFQASDDCDSHGIKNMVRVAPSVKMEDDSL
jgi:hypothetical protein